MSPLTEPLLSAVEIAELFSVHPSTIRRMAREGRIPTYWIGATPRFAEAEVAARFRQEAKQPVREPKPRRQTSSKGPTSQVDRRRLRAELYA